MPNRAWSRKFEIVAIGFVIAVAALILFAAYHSGKQVGAQRNEKQTHTAQYAADASQEIQDRCLGLIPAEYEAECIRKVVEATHEHNRAERDVVAQNEMALWAFGMFIISGGSLVLTFAGLWLIFGTLHYTKKAAQYGGISARAAIKTVTVTREIGEAQVRAYLSIESLDYDVLHGGDIKVALKCRNMGQSPARNVQAVFEVTIEPYEGSRTSYNGAINLPDTDGKGDVGEEMVFLETGMPPNCRDAGAWVHLHIAIFAKDVFNKEIFAYQRSTRFAKGDRSGDIRYLGGKMYEVAKSEVVNRLRLRWQKNQPTNRRT